MSALRRPYIRNANAAMSGNARLNAENDSLLKVATVSAASAGIHHTRLHPRATFVSESSSAPVANSPSCSDGPSRPTIPDHAYSPAKTNELTAAPPTTRAEDVG